MNKTIILLIILACSIKAMDHKKTEKEIEENNKVIKHFCLRYWREPYLNKKHPVAPQNISENIIVLPEFSPLYNLRENQQKQVNIGDKVTPDIEVQAQTEAQEDFAHLMKKLFPSDQH